MFSYVIPLIFSALKTRELFYNKLLSDVKLLNKFYNILIFFYNSILLSKLNLRSIT